MEFDFAVIGDSWQFLAYGVWITILLSAVSGFTSLAAGLVIALLRLYGPGWLRVPWVAMGRKLKQLAVLPKENNCQNSTEKAAPVGMAIDKNQPAFLEWTRAVEKEMEPQLKKDEARVIDTMK